MQEQRFHVRRPKSEDSLFSSRFCVCDALTHLGTARTVIFAMVVFSSSFLTRLTASLLRYSEHLHLACDHVTSRFASTLWMEKRLRCGSETMRGWCVGDTSMRRLCEIAPCDQYFSLYKLTADSLNSFISFFLSHTICSQVALQFKAAIDNPGP